ncbi:NlpC/P60 family protein [Zhouia sp. PK063]|uniref:C40 family peptidase n=1 Tax=Zhouia sp. PK063 TaxID=3373602 RepID=UPI0037A300BB
MKRTTIFFLCTISILGTFTACTKETTPAKQTEANNIITITKQEFAPDKRVALLNVTFKNDSLVGETNLPVALDSLENRLTAKNIAYTKAVTILPDTSVANKTQGVITLSTANLRGAPKHSAEMVTQAIMGTAVQIFKKEGGWYLIQTPDHYFAWVDAPAVQPMTSDEFTNWKNANKVVYTNFTGRIYADKAMTTVVSDINEGDIVKALHTDDNVTEVQLPDGRKGFIKNTNIANFKTWAASRERTPENLIATAKSMLGVPYLWGGTSLKGVDCSGFTKTIYYLNGWILPRDASQQIYEGTIIDSTKTWSNLQVGDLLFFGKPATKDHKERVIHVGMWIGGDEQFIHSSGKVRISSMNPKDSLYDEYNLNRYLRSVRIIGNQTKNILPVSTITE